MQLIMFKHEGFPFSITFLCEDKSTFVGRWECGKHNHTDLQPENQHDENLSCVWETICFSYLFKLVFVFQHVLDYSSCMTLITTVVVDTSRVLLPKMTLTHTKGLPTISQCKIVGFWSSILRVRVFSHSMYCRSNIWDKNLKSICRNEILKPSAFTWKVFSFLLTLCIN